MNLNYRKLGIVILSITGMLLIGVPLSYAQMVFSAQLQTAPTAAAPCGNDSGGGSTATPADDGSDDPDNETPDPINVYTCDEVRKTDDLVVWGSVGQKTLTWSRFAHSRSTPGKAWFGQGHNWRYSFQWEMADAGTNGSGQAQVTINYPDGGSFTFTQVSSTQWTGVVGCPDILTQSGNDFYLLRTDGRVFHFVYSTGGVGGIDYLMTDITDSQGAVTTLTYDSHNRLSVVTEPGGRTLTVKYALLDSTPGGFKNLATISSQPPSGTWSTINIPTNTKAYRYLRYLSADDGHCDIAEIQFFDTNGVAITGTPFGSGPAAATNTGYAEAFDGDVTTYCDQQNEAGGYTGIDLGAGATQVVGSIQYYPRVGYESRMIAPNSVSQINGTFQGSNDDPEIITVITEVDCSDGRKVVYNYQQGTDPTGGYVYQVLSGVTYDDGTQASYTYTQIQPSTLPLVAKFVDPRYVAGAMAEEQVTYYTDQSNIFGAVYQQAGYQTGDVVATIGGVIGGDFHKPSVTYGWGGTESYWSDPRKLSNLQ